MTADPPAKARFCTGPGSCRRLVVLSGRVGVVESGADADQMIEVYGQGGVLGEVGMLEEQPALFSARVVRGGEMLAVPADHLSNVALRDSVLGEPILRRA